MTSRSFLFLLSIFSLSLNFEGCGGGSGGGLITNVSESTVQSSYTFVSSGVGLGSGPSYLYKVELSDKGKDSLIGKITPSNGGEIVITDIAMTPEGNLYGISFDSLFQVNQQTAVATLIGSTGFDSMNALLASTDGQLLGATFSGDFISVDKKTAKALRIGKLGSDFVSSGDMVFDDSGNLFLVARGNPNDLLLKINPKTGEIISSFSLDISYVFGLAFVNSALFGFTTNLTSEHGALYSINKESGKSEFIRSLSFNAFGASKKRGK